LDVCTSDVTGFRPEKDLSLFGVPNRMATDFVGLRAMPFSQNQMRRDFKHDSSIIVWQKSNIELRVVRVLLLRDLV